MIERLGGRYVIDVKMDMPEDGAARHAAPALAARGFQQIFDIEMVGRHVQLTLVVAPRSARPVGVNFDAESVGVGEINGFADEVIRHAGVGADLAQVSDESSKRCAVG